MSVSKTKIRRLAIGFATMPIVLLMTACVDDNLKAVEKFGLTSAAVKQAGQLVADDVYLSCLRVARRYSLPISRFPAQSAFNSIASFEDRCSERKSPLVTDINQANLVLTSYVEGLGALASNDTVDFEANLNALESSIVALPAIAEGFPEEGVNAGLKIARFIFNQFTLQFRQDNIKEALICADNSIRDYVDGLKFLSQRVYVDGSLREERVAMENHYQTLKPSVTADSSDATERIATFLMREKYADESEVLARRKDAANAYSSILEATAKTHHKLRNIFSGTSHNDNQQYDSFCALKFADSTASQSTETSSTKPPIQSQSAPIDSDPAESKANTLTPAQQIAVREILDDYNQEVKSLARQVSHALGQT